MDQSYSARQLTFGDNSRYISNMPAKSIQNQPPSRSAAHRLFFVNSIKLSDELSVELTKSTGPKWNQLALEGDYPGYHGGEFPFSLTRLDFEQMITNLHNNPAFSPDATGVGSARVIPWDFHHSSEMNPVEGSIPITGAPAQAWTYDLQIRAAADGKSELWGLTEFLEPARTYVLEKKYQWASIAAAFDYIDPATGKNVGTILTSVALTNQPIVQGMKSLVVASTGSLCGKCSSTHLSYFSSAVDLPDALSMVKHAMGLPATCTIAELTNELAKLRQAISNPDPGIDSDKLIGELRQILNLPVLSKSDEVLDEMTKMISGLIQIQSNSAPAIPPGAQTATAAKETSMELLKILASRLGVREADAAVDAAVDDLVALKVGIQKLLGSESDGSKILLEGVERATVARAKLTALLKALGVEDPEASVNRVAELMASAKELAKVMPELASLKAIVQKTEEDQAEADVDAVIAARNYGPEIKDALLMLRKSDPAKFRASYPQIKPGDFALMSSFVPGSTNPKDINTTVRTVPVTNAVNLSLYPGRNPTERAMSYIRSSIPGADKWTHEQVFTAACELKRQPNVISQ